MKTNAQRFLTAYNTIDYSLRSRYNFVALINYSDLIRKCVSLSSIVRKYEDELVDYGRLRNAIVHRSNQEYIIAEPHDDVVENIERLAKLISTPPTVLESIKTNSVVTAPSDAKIKEVISIISKTGFSNIPIIKKKAIIGVANGSQIIDLIGREIAKNENVEAYISKTKIEDVLENDLKNSTCMFADAKINVEQVMQIFNTNKKVRAILITKSGSNFEMPLAIITVADLIEINRILEQ